jgi:opacity protein-like surface antigen
MKERYRFSPLVLAFCVGAVSAGAQQYQNRPGGAGPYCRFELGPSVFQDGRLTQFGGPASSTVEYDVGFAGSAAFGYAFNPYLAADFEFGGIGTQIHSVSGYYLSDTYMDNLPFMANFTLSFPIRRTILVPYLGGGVGGSLTIFSTDGFWNESVVVFGDDSEFVFAWQAFAGLRFQLNKQMSLGIGYKYFATQDSSFSFPPGYPYTGPSLSMGFEGVRAHSVMVSFQAGF